MLAVNYSTIREHLKDYCDKAAEESEAVIVTRKNEKNVVILSLEQYNQMLKAMQNLEYLQKLERSIQQLENGGGKAHDLIEDSDCE